MCSILKSTQPMHNYYFHTIFVYREDLLLPEEPRRSILKRDSSSFDETGCFKASFNLAILYIGQNIFIFLLSVINNLIKLTVNFFYVYLVW